MSDKERGVYRLIRGHYAQFMLHHELDRTVAYFDDNHVAFRAVGKRIVVLRWERLFQAVPAAEEDEDNKEKDRAQILLPPQKASRAQVQQAQPKAQQT